MKTKSAQNFVLIVAFVVMLAYFWYQHQQMKLLQQTLNEQNQQLKIITSFQCQTGRAFAAQTELVNELAQKAPKLDASVLMIVNKLNELAFQWALIIPDVAQELTSASNLLQAEEAVKSVSTMATIAENLLKKWLYEDQEFKKRFVKKLGKQAGPSINLGNLIAYASEKRLLTVEEITLLKEVQAIRNESCHELAVHKAKTYLLGCQEQCIDFLKRFLPQLMVVQQLTTA